MATQKPSSTSVYKFVTWTLKSTGTEYSDVFCFQKDVSPIDQFSQAKARIAKGHDCDIGHILITSFPV